MSLKSGLRFLTAMVMVLASARAFAQDVKPVDMTPASLKVGFFGKNVVMLAAQDQGFFAAQNLSVTYLQIQSSEQAFTDLSLGNYDIILSSVDNVVNYRTNPHNALGAIQPVQAFMSVDYANNLTAAGRIGITSVEDFRGKTVAVDAPASGFAYVLYEILAKHGLHRGTDYNVTSMGGGLQRFLAVTGKSAATVDGTLLNNGFEIRAAAQGLPLFETAYDITYPYLGSVGVAEEPWMQAHSDVLIRFIRAYVAASNWAFDEANHDAAVQEMVTSAVPNFSTALATKLLKAQLTFGRGLVRDAYIGDFEREGLANVLQLRQKYDGFETKQNLTKLATPAGGVYNLVWYHQAIGDSDTGE